MVTDLLNTPGRQTSTGLLQGRKREGPLRLKEAALAQEALDLKLEHLASRSGSATNELCELGQTPWHPWVSESDLNQKMAPGIICKIKSRCVFLGQRICSTQ